MADLFTALAVAASVLALVSMLIVTDFWFRYCMANWRSPLKPSRMPHWTRAKLALCCAVLLGLTSTGLFAHSGDIRDADDRTEIARAAAKDQEEAKVAAEQAAQKRSVDEAAAAIRGVSYGDYVRLVDVVDKGIDECNKKANVLLRMRRMNFSATDGAYARDAISKTGHWVISGDEVRIAEYPSCKINTVNGSTGLENTDLLQ